MNHEYSQKKKPLPDNPEAAFFYDVLQLFLKAITYFEMNNFYSDILSIHL